MNDTYREELYWDEEAGVLRSTIIQDLTPVLEANKAQFNAADSNWKGDWHHVARIPRALVADLIRKGVNIYNPDERDEKEITRMLNDIGYQNLRTKPGRL